MIFLSFLCLLMVSRISWSRSGWPVCHSVDHLSCPSRRQWHLLFLSFQALLTVAMIIQKLLKVALQCHLPVPWALKCILSRPLCLFVFSLFKYSYVASNTGTTSLLQTFPLVSQSWDSSRHAHENWEGGIQYLSLFHVLCPLLHSSEGPDLFYPFFCSLCTYRNPFHCLWHPQLDSTQFWLWLSYPHPWMIEQCFCIPPILPVPVSSFCMFSLCVWVYPGAPVPISLVEKTYAELLVFFCFIKNIKQLSVDLRKHTLFHFFARGKRLPISGRTLGANTFVRYMKCWISWGRFIEILCKCLCVWVIFV